MVADVARLSMRAGAILTMLPSNNSIRPPQEAFQTIKTMFNSKGLRNSNAITIRSQESLVKIDKAQLNDSISIFRTLRVMVIKSMRIISTWKAFNLTLTGCTVGKAACKTNGMLTQIITRHLVEELAEPPQVRTVTHLTCRR